MQSVYTIVPRGRKVCPLSKCRRCSENFKLILHAILKIGEACSTGCFACFSRPDDIPTE